MSISIQTQFEDILAKLTVKHRGTRNGHPQCQCICPAHEDRQASLSVGMSEDGKRILIHCQAGCDLESVLRAVNAAKRDLFEHDDDKKRPGPGGNGATKHAAADKQRPDVIYPYRNAAGDLLFEVVRYSNPKSFRQRRPDPTNPRRRIWDMTGITRVPYNLPNVAAAIAADSFIFVVEGEKDVHNLARIRCVATTNPGGAGKWFDSYSEHLRGAHIIAIPDNHRVGYEHMLQVLTSVQTVAASTAYLPLPDVPYKGDVSDYLATHAPEEFYDLCQRAVTQWCAGMPLTPPPGVDWRSDDPAAAVTLPGDSATNNAAAAATDYPLTDLGNAERLIAQHGATLRYNVDRKLWLRWNTVRWEYDTRGVVEQLAVTSIRGLYQQIPVADADRAKAILSHIKKSESCPRLRAVTDLARYLPGVAVHNGDLDNDQWLLNCLNGTVDLRTGALRPHDAADLITNLAPIEYIPTAAAPRWEQFLAEVFQGDQDLISFARRMIGYCLTGDTREESVFILTGKGQNGKSKFVQALAAVLSTYAADTPFTTFTERRDTNTADLAALQGKRLVTASEGEDSQNFNEALLKKLSGGDPVTCRFLYCPQFTYQPTYKILFSTNDVPHIRSQNFAMKRRIKIVPFRQRFYDPADGKTPVKDDMLALKLLAERAGIFAWAVRGCLEWQRVGLATPFIVRNEVAKLFDSHDPIAEFIESQCVVSPQVSDEVGNIWQRYLEWCEETKRRPAIKAVQWFSRNLSQRDGIDSRRGTNGIRLLDGIALLNHENAHLADDDDDLFERGMAQPDANTIVPESFPMKNESRLLSENIDFAPDCAIDPDSPVWIDPIDPAEIDPEEDL